MSIQLFSSLLNGTCSNTHDGTVSATATSVTAADTMGTKLRRPQSAEEKQRATNNQEQRAEKLYRYSFTKGSNVHYHKLPTTICLINIQQILVPSS